MCEISSSIAKFIIPFLGQGKLDWPCDFKNRNSSSFAPNMLPLGRKQREITKFVVNMNNSAQQDV